MSRRTSLLVAALVIVVALSVRAQGLRIGLPYQTDIDEPLHLTGAHRIAAFETADHGIWTYPSFFFYVLAAEFVAVRHLGGLAPVLRQDEFPIYHLAGRMLVVALGTALVALTIAWAARALGSLALGLVAGLCMAVFPLAVSESQLVTTNMCAVLIAQVALLAALVAHDTGSRRWLLAAAACSGLAASTKYNSGLVVLAPVAVALARPAVSQVERLADVARMGAVALAVFLAGSPLLPFRLGAFLPAFRELLHHYSTGHVSAAPPHSYARHLATLAEQLGPGGIALALVGLVALVRLGGRGLALWPFPVAYFLFVGWFTVDFPRTLLPIMPALALAVAAGFGALASRGRVPALLALAALLLTVSQAAVRAHAGLQERTRTAETMLAAKEWAEAHLEAGARVVGEWHCPPLNEWPAERTFELRYEIFAMGKDLPTLAREGARYVVESGMYPRLVANPQSARPGTLEHRVRQNYENLHRSGRLLATFGDIRFWELPR